MIDQSNFLQIFSIILMLFFICRLILTLTFTQRLTKNVLNSIDVSNTCDLLFTYWFSLRKYGKNKRQTMDLHFILNIHLDQCFLSTTFRAYKYSHNLAEHIIFYTLSERAMTYIFPKIMHHLVCISLSNMHGMVDWKTSEAKALKKNRYNIYG
jgi:hypothetical protein